MVMGAAFQFARRVRTRARDFRLFGNAIFLFLPYISPDGVRLEILI